jgi:hypothetical protein
MAAFEVVRVSLSKVKPSPCTLCGKIGRSVVRALISVPAGMATRTFQVNRLLGKLGQSRRGVCPTRVLVDDSYIKIRG